MLQELTMIAVFHAALHVVLVAAIVGILLLIYAVIFEFNPSRPERILRSIAACAGLLLVLGAQALGVSIPVFLLSALAQGGAVITGTLGALLPAALGFLCAYYVNRYFSSRDARRNVVGMRVLAMVMTMVLITYCNLYIATVDAGHADDFKLLLPNLTFLLALMLFAIFRYHPLPATEAAVALLVLILGGALLIEPTQAQSWIPPAPYYQPPPRPLIRPLPQPMPFSQVKPWLPPAYPPGTLPGTMINPPPTYVVPPAPAPTQIWPQYR